jgi:hypothetical protein
MILPGVTEEPDNRLVCVPQNPTLTEVVLNPSFCDDRLVTNKPFLRDRPE